MKEVAMAKANPFMKGKAKPFGGKETKKEEMMEGKKKPAAKKRKK